MFRFRCAPVLLALVSAPSVAAHEIPSEVVVRMLARARGEALQAAVRVPLRSMRDVEVPEFGPGYLDIEALSPRLDGLAAQWIAPFVRMHEGRAPLPQPTVVATQLSLPSDRSFESLDRALARLAAPRPANSENLVWDQIFLDVLLEYPIRSQDASFSLRPGLTHLASTVVTSLLYELPSGATRAYQFSGDPGVVPLDPSWSQAAWRFVRLGFEHILDGPDHLLFLFCLVVPLRRLGPLVWIVSAFTLAHSVTLIASAAGVAPDALWFPPLIEALIAVSILYMALENIVGPGQRRWAFALGFGLVHGFGFAFALRETLQFAGSHFLTSLLAFNLGVELGQVVVLLVLVPALAALFRYAVPERVGTIILSALAAHQAWHWSADRVGVLGLFSESLEASPTGTGLIAILCVSAAAVVGWSRWRKRRSPGLSEPT